ncbi:MAG: hypothetical protein ABS92_01330 [Thiobacillus sp. SCN 63-374]|nr:MAG: hypothetical protein ABS92_01330 [Thiobacillus sp. SCN 63-374]
MPIGIVGSGFYPLPAMADKLIAADPAAVSEVTWRQSAPLDAYAPFIAMSRRGMQGLPGNRTVTTGGGLRSSSRTGGAFAVTLAISSATSLPPPPKAFRAGIASRSAATI